MVFRENRGGISRRQQSTMGVPVIYKIDSQLNANEGGGGGIIRISIEP